MENNDMGNQLTDKEFIGLLENNKSIAGSTVIGDVIISFSSASRAKEINGCIFEGDFSIVSNTTILSLNISECTFKKNFIISDCSIENGIEIKDSHFIGTTKISPRGTNWLKINGCIFTEKIEIIIINDAEYVEINSSDKCETEFQSGLQFLKTHLRKLSIEKTRVVKELELSGVKILHIKIGVGHYDAINISGKLLNQSDSPSIIISGEIADRNKLGIGILKVTPTQNKGSLVIKNAVIAKTYFHSFNNENGSFELQNVAFTNTAIINNSNLKSVNFNEIYFDNKLKLCFDNSYLGECIFSNVIWPDNHKLYYYDEIEKTDNIDKLRKYTILREAYRQLKKVSKSHLNNIDALGFYRNEMDTYYNYLNNTSGRDGDKFILWVSKYSNDFGQNWLLPIFWIFLFSFFFYIFIGISISDCFYCLNIFLCNIGKFFLFIIPTHSIDNIDSKIFDSGFSLFWDFAARIFSSFFIFQTVYAFRKFIR